MAGKHKARALIPERVEHLTEPTIEDEYDIQLQAAREKLAEQRVRSVMTGYAEGGIPAFAKMFKRTMKFGKLSEICDDVAVVPKVCKSVPGVYFDEYSVRQLVLLVFLESFIDGQGLYSARYYTDIYGITAVSLRQAVRRGKITSQKVGKTTLYPFAEVKKEWPEVVIDLPEKKTQSKA